VVQLLEVKEKMNKKAQEAGMMAGVIAVIMLCIGVAIIWQGVIRPSVQLGTNTEHNLALGRTPIFLDETQITSFSLQGKGGVTLGTGNYTLTASTGKLNLTAKGNQYNTTTGNATYQYQDALYQGAGSSMNRTIIGFIITFFVLGALAFVANWVKSD
jgi:hypothetical protein